MFGIIRLAILYLCLIDGALASCVLPPATTNVIGRAQLFDYLMTQPIANQMVGTRSLIWGGDGSSPATTVWNTFYDTVDVDFHPGNNLSWWQTNFPQCIVYLADTKTPAYEFGGPSVPIAIWDSTCQTQYLAYVTTSAPHFNGIAVDNINALNHFARIGTCSVIPDATSCTHAGGTFTTRYSGSLIDATYVSDYATWLAKIKTTVSAANSSGCLVGNLTFSPSDVTDTETIAQTLDVWLDENGVWQGCALSSNGSGANWIARLTAVTTLNMPFIDNNYLTNIGIDNNCDTPPDVTSEQMDYILSSELLLKNSNTYFSGNAYVLQPNFEDYFSWTKINHGAASGAYTITGGVYNRTFANGIAIVNPTAGPLNFALGGSVYYRLNGLRYTGTITLPAASGMWLQSANPGGSVPGH